MTSGQRNTQVRRAVPFQWLLSKPGGAGVSTSTLGAVYLANFATACDLYSQKPLTAKGAKKSRKERKEKPSLAAAARVCPKAGAVGNRFDYSGMAGRSVKFRNLAIFGET